MRIKIELNEEASKRLLELAVQQRRSVPFQAEVLLLTALGLWPEVQPCSG